ncbi:hypothetical protein BV25DRAFT_1371077 [Artomyces pyxidatus]|uniref:Uncharacterized protein n=1 Tax=Artomyces pyxidatus TaxID=48021 RepID=A0ACB8SPB2_9AGAM|nr:hypothetical protein BV25DRAFT_1371077 [Artomyces pyxidatus]
MKRLITLSSRSSLRNCGHGGETRSLRAYWQLLEDIALSSPMLSTVHLLAAASTSHDVVRSCPTNAPTSGIPTFPSFDVRLHAAIASPRERRRTFGRRRDSLCTAHVATDASPVSQARRGGTRADGRRQYPVSWRSKKREVDSAVRHEGRCRLQLYSPLMLLFKALRHHRQHR